jgi:hypothetical protein
LAFQSDERLPLTFTQLIELVSKRQVPAHVPFFIVEVMACHINDEDVDVEVLS